MFEEDFHINMFSSERIGAIVINLSGIQLCGMVYTSYSSHGEECIGSRTSQHVTKLYQYGVNFVSMPHTREKIRTKSNLNIRGLSKQFVEFLHSFCI